MTFLNCPQSPAAERKGNDFKLLEFFLPESYGQSLALAELYVP
jgi:hypothetical protein